jgi:hypothetical protein
MGMGIWRHALDTVPRGNNSATHCKWRLSVSQGRSGRMWKRGNFLDPPGFQPWSAPPVASRYIVCAIPTPYLDRRGMKLWTSAQTVWWKSTQIYCALSIGKVIKLRATRATGRVACMGFGWNGFHDVLTRTLTVELAPLCQMYLSIPECTRYQYPDDYCLSRTRGDIPTINTDSCRLLGTDISSPVSRISLWETS